MAMAALARSASRMLRSNDAFQSVVLCSSPARYAQDDYCSKRPLSTISEGGDKKSKPQTPKKQQKKTDSGILGNLPKEDKNIPQANESWWVRDPKTGIWMPEGYVANPSQVAERVKNDPSWWGKPSTSKQQPQERQH